MKTLFLELSFESAIFTNTYNEIQHLVEKYKLKFPGDIRLITHCIKTNAVIFLLSKVSDIANLEEFVKTYYRNSLNKFGAKGYEDPPSDFKLKPSEIRWEIYTAKNVFNKAPDSWRDIETVGVKHLSTNIYVKCEAEGSQKANKAMARRLLTAKVYRTIILEKELRFQMQKTFMLVH